MKKLFCLVLALCMLVCLCACGTNYYEKLEGEWFSNRYLEEDDLKEDLELLDFEESEIEYADLTSAYLVRTAQFYEANKTYRLSFDADKSIAALRAYLDDLLHVLYANRADVEYYEGLFDDYSEEEFLDFYATEFFEYDSYDAMLDDFADYLYDLYDLLNETGTFTVDSSKISFTIVGEKDAESAGYSVKDDLLTIDFNNMSVIYTR